MSDPAFRNLALLEQSASTARVLNLRYTAIHHAHDPELADRPFFTQPALNRSIIVKHHLRANDLDSFEHRRTSATKVLLPIDHHNLRSGAKYFFIGQRDFAATMEQEFGISDPEAHDLQLLRFLEDIPSFDPFLLREQLRRHGESPAACYFNISQADTNRMLNFAQAEMQPLVDIAFNNVLGAGAALARKLLSNTNDSALAPLGQVLHLEPGQFAEGVFCWKAFLYYKWKLIHLAPGLERIAAELGSVRPFKQGDMEMQDYVASARSALQRALGAATQSVAATLQLYDGAYDGLIRQGDGVGFRDFLLDAPGLFTRLGEEVAAVDHMVSFWSYRFPPGQAAVVSTEELAAIFRDFANGLRITPATRQMEMA